MERKGVYVDIAANDPIDFSNTYFYDKCAQWRGLCVVSIATCSSYCEYSPLFHHSSNTDHIEKNLGVFLSILLFT